MLFEAAMAGVGTGGEGLIIALLGDIAKRPGSRYRTAAIYHLARAHERADRAAEAALFFTQAMATAELSGDAYYALWAENGLGRVERGEHGSGQEGLSNSELQTVPRAPRVSGPALAKQLEPIAADVCRQLPVDCARRRSAPRWRARSSHDRALRGLSDVAPRAWETRSRGRG